MLITLADFAGLAPRVDPRNLPPNAAQVATNTKLWRGVLQPFRNYSSIVALNRTGTIQTIYRFGSNLGETQYWFSFTTDVNVVRGPVAGDTTERTYYTGSGVPKITDNSMLAGGPPYPVTSYNLGVPKPTNTPTAAVTGTLTGESETRVYVYTFVTAWGEEGKPSTVSNSVEAGAGQTVTLTGLSTSPGNNVTLKRIYRSASGNTSAGYQFVAEIAASATSYADTKSAADLGETITSLYYDEPRSSMVGLTAMPGAILAGFTGNTLCFSEIGLPHAWPRKYEVSTEYDIVGLGVVGTSLAVLTKGVPYIVTGIDPASMSMQRMELQQACVSKRSIVQLGEAVMYASPDGIVSVGTGGVKLLTEELFTRDDWQALKPETIHAYFHEGRYIGFYNTGTEQAGFVLDVANRQFYKLGIYPTAGFNDFVNDALYLCFGTTVHKFEGAGTNLTYTWRSKKFVLPSPTNFTCAMVIADTYPVTLNVYTELESAAQATALVAKFPTVWVVESGARVKYVATVAGPGLVRLPSGFLSKIWEFEVIGTSTVQQIHIATSVSELKAK